MKRLAPAARVVVDAAAVLDAYLPGVDPAAALAAAQLLGDHAAGDIHLLGPPLLAWEVMVVLRRQAAGRKLSASEARERWELFRDLSIESIHVDAHAAFTLSERTGLNGYDAAYFHLAIEEQAPLITEARLSRESASVRRNAILRGLTLLHVTAWPNVRPE